MDMCMIPGDAKVELVSGAFVCHHHEGYWDAVSVTSLVSDQN